MGRFRLVVSTEKRVPLRGPNKMQRAVRVGVSLRCCIPTPRQLAPAPSPNLGFCFSGCGGVRRDYRGFFITSLISLPRDLYFLRGGGGVGGTRGAVRLTSDSVWVKGKRRPAKRTMQEFSGRGKEEGDFWPRALR